MPTLKCFYCRLFLASPPPPKTYPEAVNLTADNSLPYILTGGFRPVSSIPELAKKIKYTKYRIVLYPDGSTASIVEHGIDMHSVTAVYVNEVSLSFLTCLYNKMFCLNWSKRLWLEYSRQQFGRVNYSHAPHWFVICAMGDFIWSSLCHCTLIVRYYLHTFLN